VISVVPVVADADTLFGATTRGLLIQLDYGGLIRLHWSPLILDELSRAMLDTGRKADEKAARQNENLMRAALPHAEISTPEIQAELLANCPMRGGKRFDHGRMQRPQLGCLTECRVWHLGHAWASAWPHRL
jgi:hypothetical protein